MTITISEITHATTSQALAYAQDYYTNYYSPGDPPLTYHRFDHSGHIEVLATWGHYDLFFVQSRIKQTVLYGLPSEWTDEVAMRGWVFYRDPVTELWTAECDSTVTNLHHWQEIHALLKKESADMSDILDLLIEIRDSTANSEALLNALGSEAADLLRVESEDGDKLEAFESIVSGYKFDLDLDAGSNSLNGDPVPSGKVWKITAAALWYLGTVPTLIKILVSGVAGGIVLKEQATPVSEFTYLWGGAIYLPATTYIQGYIVGATAGDNLYLHYAGLQMNAP